MLRGVDRFEPGRSAAESRRGVRVIVENRIASIALTRVSELEVRVIVTELEGEYRSRAAITLLINGGRISWFNVGFRAIPLLVEALQRVLVEGPAMVRALEARAAQNERP